MAVCLLRFWLRNASPVKVIENPISDGIVFKNELTHLSLFEAKRVEKSQAIAAQLDGLQEQHLVSLRGTQREYSSKPLKHSIVKRILVFKQ